MNFKENYNLKYVRNMFLTAESDEVYIECQIDVYILWNVISQQRNETEIQFVLCSIP